MNFVLYNINGKFFNFEGNAFGAFVQSSEGIFSELKPKQRTKYDWPEQNGIQTSTRKPYFNPRDITLKGWIEGKDWIDLKSKFDALFGEFRKPGKQRLEITPFGQKTLVYEVLTEEQIKFDKTFKDGQMIGIFTLDLIETNPIKKIFKVPSGNFYMSIDVADQSVVEVNIGNNAILLNGPYDINQNLPFRNVVSGFLGDNLIIGSSEDFLSDFVIFQMEDMDREGIEEGGIRFNFDRLVENKEFVSNKFVSIPSDGYYTFSIFLRSDKKPTNYTISFYADGFGHDHVPTNIEEIGPGLYRIWGGKELSSPKRIRVPDLMMNFPPNTHYAEFSKPKFERGTINGSQWSKSSAEFYYISVAGDVDQMISFDTNAELIWERL